jgi:hypothetical protein
LGTVEGVATPDGSAYEGQRENVFDLEERFSEEMEQEKAQISLSELWG